MLSDVPATPPVASLLPPATLDRGVRLLGHAHSLDSLFRRLHAGKAITIGVLGASVGQNGGCLDQPGKRCMGYRGRHRGDPVGFALRLLRQINRTWPADHRINNSALDGTGVEHMAKCVVAHLPEVHLVVAEWGSMAMHTVWSLPSIERAARVLLSRPSPPALVHLSVHEWCSQRVVPRSLYRVGDVLKGSLRQWVYPDTPWAAVEEEVTRVSRHYGQAAVSVHTALAPHVLGREPGFALDDITGPDCLHPVNGRRGIEYVEALLAHWLESAHAFWHHATTAARYLLDPRQEGLPPPLHVSNAQQRLVTRCYAFVHETATEAKQLIMAKIDWCSHGNGPGSGDAAAAAGAGPASTAPAAACWAAAHHACPKQMVSTGYKPSQVATLTARQQQRLAASHAAYSEFMRSPPRHWFYCHLSLGDNRRKISAGVVALVPGATLRARVDGWGVDTTGDAEIQLEHLTSYTGMGMMALVCLGGCACEPQVIDAHKTNEIRNVSVFESHRFVARAVRSRVSSRGRPSSTDAAAAMCELVGTVLKRSSSGGHKMKVRSITVSTTSLADTASVTASATASPPPPPPLVTARGRRSHTHRVG
jgi:hypothetical protein